MHKRIENYRGYRIEPGERGLYVVTAKTGPHIGCNPMPGAALFPTPAEARIGVDLLIESGGDGSRFWTLNSYRMAEQKLAGDVDVSAPTLPGGQVLLLQHGQWLALRALAAECGVCGPGFAVPAWAAGLKRIFGEGLATQILAGPEVWTVVISFDGSAIGTTYRFRFSGRYRDEFAQYKPRQAAGGA